MTVLGLYDFHEQTSDLFLFGCLTQNYTMWDMWDPNSFINPRSHIASDKNVLFFYYS